MSELKIFENEEFGKVRTIVVNGEVWFVGKDVARALGYGEGKSLNNAIANHVDEEDKGVTEIMTPGGRQSMVVINESGLYALIFGSKLPKAKEFKHWVTSEVLPSIRKTGSYTMNNNRTVPTVKGSHTAIPMTGNCYDRQKPKIDLVCDLYGIDRKRLYHIILTNIQGVYSWDYAVMAYIKETGTAPRYAMDVVAHFQQLQQAAETVMDKLLEGYSEL